MKEITATELARRLSKWLDLVEYRGEEVVVIRNKQRIARILPGPIQITALQAMADLYRTLPDEAAKDWLQESRKSPLDQSLHQLKNPWDS